MTAPLLSPGRQAAIAYARSLDGAGADPGDPYARAEYELAIARGESQARADEMVRMSGGALVAAGVLRAAGVNAPHLAPPYRTGTAISRLDAMGVAADAWVRPVPGRITLPRPGDVVLVSPPEHVFVVIEAAKDRGDERAVIMALDGGLVARDGPRDREGYQVARVRGHEWQFGQDRARLPGGPWSRPRRVVGWLDLDALLLAYP